MLDQIIKSKEVSLLHNPAVVFNLFIMCLCSVLTVKNLNEALTQQKVTLRDIKK